MKHKHAELMIAYANDCSLEIEYRVFTDGDWVKAGTPSWNQGFEYRIKPHKWQHLIDAVAADPSIKIQYRSSGSGWLVIPNPNFAGDGEYRIEPAALRQYVYRNRFDIVSMSCAMFASLEDAKAGLPSLEVLGPAPYPAYILEE